MAVDALRGFDMFWIVGAGALVRGLESFDQLPWVQYAADQLRHVAWEGCTAYDVIFPLFVFLSGLSVVLSARNRDPDVAFPWLRVGRRVLLLFAFGVFVNGGFREPWPDVRLMGVLQRIALAWGACSVLVHFLRPRGQLLCLIGLLGGYWALLRYVPLADPAASHFEEGANLTNRIDECVLPGKKHLGLPWDPEGLLSTLPAIGSALLGALAGALLLTEKIRPLARAGSLILLGAGLCAGGFYWGETFPIIKKLWTSSFVLFTGGISFALLGLFYLIIDVWKLRLWARPFVWIGANALTIYLSKVLIDYRGAITRLVGPSSDTHWMGCFTPLVHAALYLLAIILLARFLYRRGIFIRV